MRFLRGVGWVSGVRGEAAPRLKREFHRCNCGANFLLILLHRVQYRACGGRRREVCACGTRGLVRYNAGGDRGEMRSGAKRSTRGELVRYGAHSAANHRRAEWEPCTCARCIAAHSPAGSAARNVGRAARRARVAETNVQVANQTSPHRPLAVAEPMLPPRARVPHRNGNKAIEPFSPSNARSCKCPSISRPARRPCAPWDAASSLLAADCATRSPDYLAPPHRPKLPSSIRIVCIIECVCEIDRRMW